MKIIYDRHNENYKKCLDGGPKNKIATSWLNKSTLDFWRHERMLNPLKAIINKNDTWLTIGDGRYGSEANWLLSKGISAHASDMSTDLLKKAKDLNLITEYSRQNAEELTFKNESFDYVLIKESLHHFPRPWLALYEAFRVSRKGVVIIEPNDYFSDRGNVKKKFFKRFKDFIKIILKKKINKDEYGFEEVGNFIYTMNIRELEKFMLGIHQTNIAYLFLNDHYFDGVEHVSMRDRTIKDFLLYLKLLLIINFKNIICKLGISNESLLAAILIKENINERKKQKLLQYSWHLKNLPTNPFL